MDETCLRAPISEQAGDRLALCGRNEARGQAGQFLPTSTGAHPRAPTFPHLRPGAPQRALTRGAEVTRCASAQGAPVPGK